VLATSFQVFQAAGPRPEAEGSSDCKRQYGYLTCRLVTVRGNRGPNRLLTDGQLFHRTVSQRNFVEFEIITESRSRKDQPLVIRATSVGELTIQIAQQRKRGASAEWILRTLFVLCRVQNYLAGGDEAALRHLVFVTM